MHVLTFVYVCVCRYVCRAYLCLYVLMCVCAYLRVCLYACLYAMLVWTWYKCVLTYELILDVSYNHNFNLKYIVVHLT